MDPTIESLKREVAILREKLNDTEKKLEIKEAQLRTFVRTSTPFTPKKKETILEKRPETPKSMKRERESTTFGARVSGIPRMPTHKAHAQTPAHQNSKSTKYKRCISV